MKAEVLDMSFGLRRMWRRAMDGPGSRGTTERCPEPCVLWSVKRYYSADVDLVEGNLGLGCAMVSSGTQEGSSIRLAAHRIAYTPGQRMSRENENIFMTKRHEHPLLRAQPLWRHPVPLA